MLRQTTSALRRGVPAAVARCQAPSRSLATPASDSAAFSVSEANGFKVAAQDDGLTPTSAITVVLKAGPRYEPLPGMAHILKNFVFRATSKRSALRIIRETEIYGGVLSSALSRENLFLTAEFLRGDEAYFAEILGDVLGASRLAQHEYKEDVLPTVQTEYSQAAQSPDVFALDVAHNLAFRRGLGNSLYATPHVAIPYQTAADYASQTFQTSGIAVLGSGVESSSLQSLVSEYFPSNSSSAPTSSSSSSTYYGGEVRVPSTSDHHTSHNDHATLLVALKGGPAAAAEFTVLKYLLGGVPSVKWCSSSTPLSTSAPGAQAFNVGYSDAGLVGFTVHAPSAEAGKIAKSAVSAFKAIAGGVKDEEVKRAIAKAKFTAASAYESRVNKLELVGSQVMSSGSAPSLADTFAALDKVDAKKIAETAATALKSRPTFVAIGNTHEMPHTDELGF